MKKTLLGGAVLPLALALASCGRAPELDTRTFTLNTLAPHEAQSLIAPYVYGDRAEAPGAMSVTERAITVRETSDNLQKIERVLAEYDVTREDIRLHFQLIEADGFTDSDPSIAEVEAELRKVFQFRGYRLAGEAVVSSVDGSDISQALAGDKGNYTIEAYVQRGPEGSVRLGDVSLYSFGDRRLRTSVNVRPGQTLVLGSSSMEGSTGTFLLTVRAEPPGA